MARMKLKKIEEYLQSVDGFEKPNVNLEQYPTPPHIASCMMFQIQTKYSDVEGKMVGDLGCGCGMLSIGSFLLGATHTVGFEIDDGALEVFRSNVFEMEIPDVDCVQADVLQLKKFEKWVNVFDTVVMNPPFGTKNNSGVDMNFLQTAIEMSSNTVYSLHKTSTREFINKKAKDWGIKSEVVAELKYNIDSLYKFHKKDSVDIEVDFWRFDVTNKQ